MTIRGKTCQAWSVQTPHAHSKTDPDDFPDTTLADAANYCRNPDDSYIGPWCITTDVLERWDICDVAYCGSECHPCLVIEDIVSKHIEDRAMYSRVMDRKYPPHPKFQE